MLEAIKEEGERVSAGNISRRWPGERHHFSENLHLIIMSLLRTATSVALRTPSAVHIARRGYAEASDKITFSMALPHQVCGLLYFSISSFVEFLFSQSTTPQTLSRSIFVQLQVTWVFLQTTFPPLSLSILVLWRLSNPRAGPRNSSVRYSKL